MCSWGWAGKGEELREYQGGRSGQGQGILETRYEGPHVPFQSVREEVWGRGQDDADHFINTEIARVLMSEAISRQVLRAAAVLLEVSPRGLAVSVSSHLSDYTSNSVNEISLLLLESSGA